MTTQQMDGFTITADSCNSIKGGSGTHNTEGLGDLAQKGKSADEVKIGQSTSPTEGSHWG